MERQILQQEFADFGDRSLQPLVVDDLDSGMCPLMLVLPCVLGWLRISSWKYGQVMKTDPESFAVTSFARFPAPLGRAKLNS